MEITSLQYLLFVIAFISCFHIANEKFKKVILLTASILFYGSYSLVLLFALALSTIVNYNISNIKTQYKKALIIGFNLGLLLIFKLGNVFDDTTILVPIGISFFTFQAIGYSLDFYANKITVKHNFLDFANFLSFFPQLIAGPIENFNKLGSQLVRLKKATWEGFQSGLYLISVGLAQKLIIADRCGVFVDKVYSNMSDANFFSFTIATLLFSFQIFLDFSAYCNIALGVGKMLGINLSSNFNSPYLSSSVSDFWRNWHITLHLWFKNYVLNYLKSRVNWLFSLLIIFVISGAWHGLALNFIIWGIFSFSTLLLDRYFIQKTIKNKYFTTFSTFSFITIGWILFRVNSIEDIFNIPLKINQHTLLGINQTISDFIYVLTHFDSAPWFGKIIIAHQEIPLSFLDFLILFASLISWGVISLFKIKFKNYKTTITFLLLICIGLLGYNHSQPFIYLQF